MSHGQTGQLASAPESSALPSRMHISQLFLIVLSILAILITTLLRTITGDMFGLFFPFHTGIPRHDMPVMGVLILYSLFIPILASCVFYGIAYLIRHRAINPLDLISGQFLARVPLLLPACAMPLDQDYRYLFRLQNPLPYPMTFTLFLELLWSNPGHLIHPAGAEWYGIIVFCLKRLLVVGGALWAALLMFRSYQKAVGLPPKRALFTFLPALFLIGFLTSSNLLLMDAKFFHHAMA